MQARDLFTWKHSLAAEWLSQMDYLWDALPKLHLYIERLSYNLPSDYIQMSPGIWVGKGTTIEETALIQGPAIIGRNCQIRHNAFIRPHVLIGDEVVIGNATEVKNAILFDKVQVPHFNYIGDSIMGFKSHLGAGAILSNFKATGEEIHVHWNNKRVATGMNKLGALIGDQVEVGCNTVLYPGTLVGRETIIYPLQGVRGSIPAKHIMKQDGKIVPMRSSD